MNLERAHEFLWTHARLLERRIFEHRFLGGAAEAVMRAVDAYRNADGGFGQALEPDCRTPHSQPEAMRWALAVLDAAGCLDGERARGCADWLDGFLDRLAAGQQEDGGWPIDWPAPGATATHEWRAIRALEALQTLSAYGRL